MTSPAPVPRAGRGHSRRPRESGAVLIIVLWVAFGLVSLALYFAHSMSMELRAADNRIAAIEALQAIQGAVRYATNVLGTAQDQGRLPDLWTYESEAVPIGDSTFWFLGRSAERDPAIRPVFGLVDEGAKLNLNTATADMLQWLPRMTPEIAAAIVDWRDEDNEPSAGGAEDEVYLRLHPPYRCKNAPFESVEELRLVQGMTLEILYGEDTNLNGVLDPNENDGDLTPPNDNRDGRLDPGLLEYVTVHTLAPGPGTDAQGSPRIDLSAGNLNVQALTELLRTRFGADRANAILQALGNLAAGFASTLEFYARSRMTADEFRQVEDSLFVSTANASGARVNVNTASETVLACIPGIGLEHAPTVVAQRQANTPDNTSITWLSEVLDAQSLGLASPYLTGQSYQFAIDVAAVGRHGRGFRRIQYVCDTDGGTVRLIARRDLTDLGWALGGEVRKDLQENPRPPAP